LKKNMSEEGFKNQLLQLRDRFAQIRNKAAQASPVSPQNNVSDEEMNQMRQLYPNATDEEIQKALGFSSELQTSSNGNNIGSLSAAFESGNDPGAIGYDSTGGLSYGKYQLAHNNAQKFVQQSPYAAEFKGIPFNSEAFKQKWREVAQKDPEGFASAQHEFIKQTHFEPQAQKLAETGLDVSSVSPVLKDVIWSTSVQHGANNNIVVKAVKNLPPDATEADLIKNIYRLRWNGGMNFARSTPEVRKSVYNRFFGKNGEMQMALNRLNGTA